MRWVVCLRQPEGRAKPGNPAHSKTVMLRIIRKLLIPFRFHAKKGLSHELRLFNNNLENPFPP